MIEFTRSIFNKVFLFLTLVFVLSFMLGWFLPVGLDKVNSLSYREFLFSMYTVFTQFGFLIFSFIIAFFINKEYTNKTILFYRILNYNGVKFYLNKIFVLIVESFVLIIILLIIVSIFYKDYSLFLLMLFLLMSVVSQYIIIIGLISFLSSNILLSIGLSVVYWISTVVLVSSSEKFKFLAIFDASNFLYNDVENTLSTGGNFISLSNSFLIIAYIIIILIVSVVICKVMNKRWLKLGVD